MDNGPFQVDLPLRSGDFPVRYVSLPEGVHFQKGHSERSATTAEVGPNGVPAMVQRNYIPGRIAMVIAIEATIH